MLILANVFLLNPLLFNALGKPIDTKKYKIFQTITLIMFAINTILYVISIKNHFMPSFCLWLECLASSLMWLESAIALKITNGRKVE